MTLLVLALVFMIAFTLLAVQVILWQSQDISVDIVSDTEEGSNEVTISVKNTAGTVLLFHENDEMTGKIEYLSDDGWVEYCDVYYTQGNATAISQQYSGTFAELEPGEDWEITVPEEKVAQMQNGTYRIKLAYITENEYKKYLMDQSTESSEDALETVSEESVIIPGGNISEDEEDGAIFDELNVSISDASNLIPEESETEEFYASSVSELFIKTFEYEVPEDFVSAISFDESNIKGDGFANTPSHSRMRIFEEELQ